MRTPTASSLPRARGCPGSFALPHATRTTEAMSAGTAGHAFLEDVARIGAEAALAAVPEEHRAMCADIQLDGLPLGPEYRQEIAFSFDVDTGRGFSLGRIPHRAYPEQSPSRIYGTADVIHSQRVEVWDFKFESFDSHAVAPAENAQLHFLALSAARERGATEARVGLIHIKPDGHWWAEHADLDAFALDEFEADLRAVVARVHEAHATVQRGEVPDVARGPWCRWCPAAAACPAVTSLIRAVASEPAATAEEILALLTPTTATRAYQRLREVEAALAPVKSALYLFASEFDIDLGDGRVYGATTTERDELDARKARKALAELYGPEVAEAACDFTTSKAAVTRALREVVAAKKASGEKVTAKAVNEEALAAIRAAGGVTTTSKTAVREHRAGEKETE